MNHKCPVKGCEVQVPASRLMCSEHWSCVPVYVANAVYREYRRAPRSKAHFSAMQAAVDYADLL